MLHFASSAVPVMYSHIVCFLAHLTMLRKLPGFKVCWVVCWRIGKCGKQWSLMYIASYYLVWLIYLYLFWEYLRKYSMWKFVSACEMDSIEQPVSSHSPHPSPEPVLSPIAEPCVSIILLYTFAGSFWNLIILAVWKAFKAASFLNCVACQTRTLLLCLTFG